MKESSHPGEEGKLINISLGYEIFPLCLGPEKLCVNVSQQTSVFILPPKDFWTSLGLFTALSLSINHAYTTETLGKEKKKKKHYTKGLLIKILLILLFVGTNVKPNQENQCLWLIIQLLIGDPHGM